ncbi:MAG TPA: 16S rRNA (cytosine(967)-C(5))-methyltransferase RsmB [Solirubrobacteraceae bacterium]|nr:16S rRNA (cytosine(967)-C(5))-methyltransferase RsmB [Solirubrobacteraceae bacterium]
MAGAVAPARACAYAVVRRVFEQGAYADRALASEAAGLDGRDRALATSLAYGTVQRRATLDHVIAALSDRPPERLDPPVLAALRLGLLQLLFLNGVAEHAAVHESVELAKAQGHGGAGLVNAVLRRATREGRALVDAMDDHTPMGAAIRHSVPLWLAELWFAERGPEQARTMLAAVNGPPESALRVNTLVSTPEQVLSTLGVPAHTVPGLPEALVLDGPFDVFGSAAWAQGAIMAQSRGSMLPARALAPEPGARVLDLCAAPGAKTTQLAALMGEGELVAVERNPSRARGLRATLERMHAGWVEVREADATALSDAARYDAVLVDPPCSGLGTLQSRPDLRWRTSPERITELRRTQTAVLSAGARAVKPGGTLVYSVCTISRTESADVIGAFLTGHPEFTVEPVTDANEGPFRQTLPHRDGTDGFFMARLRRGGKAWPAVQRAR